MPGPYSSSGKQVMHTVDSLNAHFATAITDDAAHRIAQALRLLDEVEAGQWAPSGGGFDVATEEDTAALAEARRQELDAANEPARAILNQIHRHERPVIHSMRQEGDEYACRCGARWDASEGEEGHP